MQKIICKNEEETKAFAKKFAKVMDRGDIILLVGELGSGKTKFVEGMLQYFGKEDEISSPTFTIVNEYHSDKGTICHFDLYRLNSIDEFDDIGGEEYFEKGICVFEWGELIESILPQNYIKITFEKDEKDENLRTLIIETFGRKYDELDFNELN